MLARSASKAGAKVDAAGLTQRALSSIFQTEAALFDDGIGEHLARDALHLRRGGRPLQAIVKGEDKVFSLANIGDSAILHPAQRIRHGLPLGIEHGSFQRDIDMSLHLA